jgi:protochlorophyllide reductase
MINNKLFRAGKAYEDSKLCNIIISRELHRRYHEQTGIILNTVYPGCTAETALSSHAPQMFQKNITKGHVSQLLSDERVAQVVAHPEFTRSGVHWSWGNRQKTGAQPFAQPLSAKAQNKRQATRLWELNAAMLGLPGAGLGPNKPLSRPPSPPIPAGPA